MNNIPSAKSNNEGLFGFHTQFLWRVTGFPFELIEQLSSPELGVSIEAVFASCEDAATKDDSEQSLTEKIEDYRQRYDTDLDRLRIVLKEVYQDERLLEAIAHSSKESAERVQTLTNTKLVKRTSKEKQRELLAVRYLQRFTTKCETSAYFGPTSIGKFEPSEHPVSFQLDHDSYNGYGFVSARLLNKLCSLLREQPGVLKSQMFRTSSAITRYEDCKIAHPLFGQLELDRLSIDILTFFKERKSAQKLYEQKQHIRSNLDSKLHKLIKQNILFDELSEVQQQIAPLPHLLTFIENHVIDASIYEAVNYLNYAVQEWPNQSLKTKLASTKTIQDKLTAIGIEMSVKKHGNFYADHMPVFEDGFCSKNRLTLNSSWAASYLYKISRILESGRETLESSPSEERMTSQFEKSNTTRVFSFSELCRSPYHNENDNIEQRLAQKAPRYEFVGPLITSPDIQIAAKCVADVNSDQCKWVLAESHTAISSLSFFMRVIPATLAWVETVSHYLKSNLRQFHLVNICSEQTNKTSLTHPVKSCYELEVSAVASSHANILNIEDIEVRIEKNKKATAIHKPTGKRILFLPPNSYGSTGAISFFRTPSCFSKSWGTHPRVENEGIIVKRATWHFPDLRFLGKLKSSFDIFTFMQLLKFTNKLPRWVYIKADRDRKPVFIDFYNPFLCEEFAKTCSNSLSVSVEEMYPTPDDAWLKTESGRYFSELRLLYVTPEIVSQ